MQPRDGRGLAGDKADLRVRGPLCANPAPQFTRGGPVVKIAVAIFVAQGKDDILVAQIVGPGRRPKALGRPVLKKPRQSPQAGIALPSSHSA